ncbi:LPD1 domain-containing protein, partial [Microbulbifer sp. TYP-18]|uniref:LPD1 domain-containing protein n=1 Tax=Microbulbifer sp. TYP-18 TaxID=3230024 RepID=UPI0034C6AD37
LNSEIEAEILKMNEEASYVQSLEAARQQIAPNFDVDLSLDGTTMPEAGAPPEGTVDYTPYAQTMAPLEIDPAAVEPDNTIEFERPEIGSKDRAALSLEPMERREEGIPYEPPSRIDALAQRLEERGARVETQDSASEVQELPSEAPELSESDLKTALEESEVDAIPTSDIDVATDEAPNSPKNDIAESDDAQKEADKPVSTTPAGAETSARDAATILEQAAARMGSLDKLRSYARGRFGKQAAEGMKAEIQTAWDKLEKQRASPGDSVHDIETAANGAATSPLNNLPEPTEAQKEAGNYKVGKLKLHGLELSIENPRGSIRSGTSPDGKRWQNTLPHHYGYIRKTEGADGDHVDVFVGPDVDSERVFVVDQVNRDGSFDEHKVLLGFSDKAKAIAGYKGAYDKGWKVGPVTAMELTGFKDWLKGDTSRPVSQSFPASTSATKKRQPSRRKKREQPRKKIEDIGEKMAGARKDAFQNSTAALKSGDLANQPLGKIWPKDAFQDLGNPFVEAFAHAVRATIPAKPRKPYKRKRWVEEVETLRDFLQQDVLDQFERGQLDADLVLKRMRGSSALAGLAEKISLMVTLDKSDWSRIGRVSYHPETHSYTRDGKQTPSRAMLSVEIDGHHESFYGDKARIPAKSLFAQVVKRLQSAAKEPSRQDLDRFEVRGRKDYAAIVRKGDKEYRPLKTFTGDKAGADALKFKRANIPVLNAEWEKVKARDNVGKRDVRLLEMAPRVGAEHRVGDEDVEPQAFMDTFGFRGVEFGNWVRQGADGRERQGLLNQAYDALMDLAAILDVPPLALSLNGGLGLAFGSRGKGSASAHFEPNTFVINLTKTKGAGTLAHEWFHALDYYFQAQRNDPFLGTLRRATYITYSPETYYVHKRDGMSLPARDFEPMAQGGEGSRGQRFISARFERDNWQKVEGVRPAVEMGFAELVETLNASPMRARASVIDKDKVDGYWSRIIERAARAFENYVIAKLADSGAQNDYLASVASIEQFKRNPERYPYLLESEMAPVKQAFDQLFSTLKTRSTDKGVALYALGIGKGIQPALAKAALSRVKQSVGVDAEVVADESGLPMALRQQIESDGVTGRVRGIYHTDTGTAYIVAGNLNNPVDAVRIYLHEVVGHKGIRAVTGKRLDLVLTEIYRDMPAEVRDTLEGKYRSQLQGLSGPEARRWVADEYVAHLAENDPKNSLLQRIIAVVRRWLRQLGLTAKWTEADIVALLARGKRALRRGGKGKRKGKKSKGKEQGPLIELQYSLSDPSTDEALARLGLGKSESQGIRRLITRFQTTNLRQAWANVKERSYEGVFDGLVGIQRAEEAAGKGTSAGDYAGSGYVGARLASSIADTMHAILHYGAPEWRDGVVQYRDDTQGLLTIFKGLGPDLNAWLG